MSANGERMNVSVSWLVVVPPVSGIHDWLSPAYMAQPRPNCFSLFVQEMALAFSRALLNAGRSIAAKIAMIAITTSNSIRVNDLREMGGDSHCLFLLFVLGCLGLFG